MSLQTLLPALAAAVATTWVLLGMGRQGAVAPGQEFVLIAAACAAAAAGTVAGLAAARQPVALLAWDSQQWTVDAVPAMPAVMIDLGGWLLLRLCDTAPSRQRWVAVSRAHAGPAWHSLRAALFAQVPAQESAPRV